MSKRYLALSIGVCMLSSLLSHHSAGQQNSKRPPMEVFIVDQEELPVATGKPGTTYTAAIFVVDNVKKKVMGPYSGSSFPNSKQSLKDKEKPNTLQAGIHIFNNKYGHKGGSLKGLNLVNIAEERKTKAFSWSKKPTTIVYANVHTGSSDNGNFNSRGSQGCITLHPKQVEDFFKNFDFSKGKTGVSQGTVIIYRANAANRTKFINQLKKIY